MPRPDFSSLVSRMSNLNSETVTRVHHWNDTLFSFRTTRDAGFRFRSGHFVMVGLEIDGRPLLRAYSVASASHADELEFFSIKVPDGPLTQHLQHLEVGDRVLVGRKSTGTLTVDHLLPGNRLWLLATGTGLAPFMSIIRDPEVYEHFDQVVLVHGVRFVSELAYADTIKALADDELMGELVRDKLCYYPTVTREPSLHTGRITRLMEDGTLFADLGVPAPQQEHDRFMLCGSPAMLKDLTSWLEARGFREYRIGDPGHFTIERAFVEK